MSFQIPLSDLDYGAEEAAAVRRVLEGKWLSMGPETGAFEKEFAAAVGVPHACAVSNGTAALHLAFLALGLGPGDEVIQPAVNFVASANMTKAVGATPIFGEIIGLDEPTLDPAAIERLMTPHAKAVVVMHYGGYFCRMAEIRQICRRNRLALIEDACHAVGATCTLTSGSAAAGALGDIGCFSFFSNKNLVTGEGGMVTTGRDDLNDRVRNLRSHGMSTLTWDRHRGHAATYDVLTHGYNYRIDDLRSALGREQLKKLDRNNQRRRELTVFYWQKLASLESFGWTLPFRKLSISKSPFSTSNSSACHLLPVVAPDADTRWRCAEALKSAGIQTSLHYPFIPGFTGFVDVETRGGLDMSIAFCQRIITLPLFPTMTEAQVQTVCATLLAAAHSP